MTLTSRRILAYWLLLLLPTLGVGTGAIILLRREQSRLADRANYADEARRAAVKARAQLIAENVELLVGDVQNGLLDLLATESAGGSEPLLDQLEKSNPLVRTVFRCSPDGRVVRPAAEGTDDEGRSFLRRFGSRLKQAPPWRSETVGAMRMAPAPAASGVSQEPATAAREELAKQEDYQARARQQVASNVAKVQSNRRDVQALANNTYGEAARAALSGTEKRKSPSLEGKSGLADQQNRELADAGIGRNKDEAGLPPGLRGWWPLKVDGRLHLLGWVVVPAANEVRGVELEMTALISRLGGSMPVEVSADEGYVLRDDAGRVWHQAGAVARDATPGLTVPLAADLLPGWEVVAFVPTVDRDSGVGGGFLVVGSLLVGIFVIAIVVGGSLLLRQAQRSEAEAAQKTSFVANVSHEFKTPLTTIRLYAELLEQGRVRDAAQSGDYLRTIGRETQRLARLVGNALDFSRLEQGHKKYVREPLDLRVELARLLDTQAPRLAEAGVALHRELPAESLSVTTDRDAWEQIILNLLDNAAKYGAAGGEVTVTLRAEVTGGVQIAVLDRGPGVATEHRERIFEKFHRVDDTLTAQKAGAGLGLSIARQLARGLGGELRYAPRLGGGASFILTLP